MDKQENKNSSNKTDSGLERHNLTVNGQAEAIGMIAVNSANPDHDEHIHSEKKKERDLEELLHLDELAQLEEYMRILGEKIDAGTQLLNAYKNGERDFDSVDHLQLLAVTGWKKDEIIDGTAVDTLDQWKDEHTAGLAQLKMFREVKVETSNFIAENEDHLLSTSIKTTLDLKSTFNNAVEGAEPMQPERPSIVIPAPGQIIGF